MEDLQASIDAVNRSKICARNYADTPVESALIDHLAQVAMGGPFKQGRRYFDIYTITDPDKMDKIWKHTARPDEEAALKAWPKKNKDGTQTTFIGNAQVLAPVLFVFAGLDTPTPDYPDEEHWDPTAFDIEEEEQMNTQFAVGSAMGMLTFEANRLGLHTGNCVCFDPHPITEMIKEWSGRDDFDYAALLVGVGYPTHEWSPEAEKEMRKHPHSVNHVYEPPDLSDRGDPAHYTI
jgi:nitroreductase